MASTADAGARTRTSVETLTAMARQLYPPRFPRRRPLPSGGRHRGERRRTRPGARCSPTACRGAGPRFRGRPFVALSRTGRSWRRSCAVEGSPFFEAMRAGHGAPPLRQSGALAPLRLRGAVVPSGRLHRARLRRCRLDRRRGNRGGGRPMIAPHLDDHDVPAVTYDLDDDGRRRGHRLGRGAAGPSPTS